MTAPHLVPNCRDCPLPYAQLPSLQKCITSWVCTGCDADAQVISQLKARVCAWDQGVPAHAGVPSGLEAGRSSCYKAQLGVCCHPAAKILLYFAWLLSSVLMYRLQPGLHYMQGSGYLVARFSVTVAFGVAFPFFLLLVLIQIRAAPELGILSL